MIIQDLVLVACLHQIYYFKQEKCLFKDLKTHRKLNHVCNNYMSKRIEDFHLKGFSMTCCPSNIFLNKINKLYNLQVDVWVIYSPE